MYLIKKGSKLNFKGFSKGKISIACGIVNYIIKLKNKGEIQSYPFKLVCLYENISFYVWYKISIYWFLSTRLY